MDSNLHTLILYKSFAYANEEESILPIRICYLFEKFNCYVGVFLFKKLIKLKITKGTILF